MSGLDYFASRVEDTQLTPELLGKEPNEMHCRTRFHVVKDHRLRQLPSAQLETIFHRAQFKRVHFCS